MLSIAFLISPLTAQTSSGRLTGKVLDKDGKPMADVTVVATNQTSTEAESDRTNADGSFSMRLRAGAYRLTVASPYEARFDRGKLSDYGVFSNVICDESKKKCAVLENVIIDGGDRKIDIVAVDPKTEMDRSEPAAVAAVPERREVRDRWRIGYPEYDRYGDKAARGRDIPFRRSRWYNPYDHNLIKGDRPIFGKDYFLILSGVSTTQVELRRTPSATNVSAAQPDFNNFLGSFTI